ncbi:CRISPR-associated protein Cas1 [Methanosalsum zhilinae DSM 4017]|uniref:CRISPR-associated endonuclease Cas1 n=1 Tax=Methanosalsum zhilinae (strain DSM 4017 / NBRC 107636 / OCM 62 / WeN5) TaxID=679901 RepID=F7XPH0_METZD|nr:type I-E CRISPR-associated endonuclease Cas1e [Methanosalsum zhilinae]AEH61395.1 CRISPR-associated protein Cas1 [Methanosalsum zhilinae DSM 4017]
MLRKPKPISIKERFSLLFLEKGELDVINGSFVLIDKNGVRVQIPVGGIACLMLEPGTRVSHKAAALASDVGCLLIWVGEAGVRLYSAGQPGGARADRLLYQAKLALDEELRKKVVRKMYSIRFNEVLPDEYSIEQMRGMEAARVKKLYQIIAKQYGVEWKGRKYDPNNWDNSDIQNKCLSSATSCIYGVTEAAILAAGYSPAVGFIHTGKPRSFVYDIADLFKFETVVPIAFRIASENHSNYERAVRLECRNSFRETRLLKKIIPTIEEVLAAGDIDIPKTPSDSVPPAIPNKEGIGDAGHRN